jgi:hypothetical protein
MTVPMEKISTQTLLGIRFWDAAANRQVRDGLRVTAQLLSGDGSRRVGRPVVGQFTLSGVVAFFGLHPDERPPANTRRHLWDDVPASRQVVVDVTDTRRRYLPMAFRLTIPHRGAYTGQESWVPREELRPLLPDGQSSGVYLWTAASSSIPAGLTMIRAQMVVGNSEEPPPAAHAFVVIYNQDDQPYACGLTGADGMLALPLAYPRIQEPADSSPLPALAQQTFPLRVRVFYRPADQEILPGSTVPNLPSLFDQAQATIGTERNPGPPPQLTTRQVMPIELSYGIPFVLRTDIVGAPDERESILRIEPV